MFIHINNGISRTKYIGGIMRRTCNLCAKKEEAKELFKYKKVAVIVHGKDGQLEFLLCGNCIQRIKGEI